MAATRAQLNRAVRQEALREQLAKQKLVEHVLDTVQKLNDPTADIPKDMVDRYKIVIDTRLKLINKYLPDMRNVEISGDPDSPVITKTEVILVRPPSPST